MEYPKLRRAREPKREVNCETCKKEFYITSTRYRKNKHHTCSSKCSGKLSSKLYSKKFNTVCYICNKEIKLKKYHTKRYKGPFCCSRLCRAELLKTVYKGSSNPNHKYLDNVEKYFVIRCNAIKLRAKQNNLPFDLIHEDLNNLYLKQNGLCYYTGIPMKLGSTNFKNKGQTDLDALSVDKIIPELGYVKNNIVLCCSAVNKLKGNSDVNELQEFLTALGLKTFGTCCIKFKKIRDNALAPFRAKLGDGGYDLSASKVEDLGDKIKVYTGIACEPDFGWVLLALPRSSIVNKSYRLSNSIGLIDNQFRGEITAFFDKKDLNATINIGDRIIQLVPLRTPYIEMQEVDELSESDRNEKGFGSSGT